MNEKILLLERSIDNDLRAIEKIYSTLGPSPSATNPTEADLIVLSYRLHSLYNAFENILYNIATTFENALDDRTRWHTQLLQRMRLDLSPIRPAVISEAMYDKLDELRRFRHLFRTQYNIQLDPDRLYLVWRKAVELRDIYRPEIERFLTFLQTLH